MAIQSAYPTSLDTARDDKASGDEVRVDDWNLIMDAVYQLEKTVGVSASTVASSLTYAIQSVNSFEPGHRHTMLYDNSATTIVVSGRSSQQLIRIAGVNYSWPSSAPTAATWLLNDGGGTLEWKGCLGRCAINASANQTVAATTAAKNACEQIVFTATATGDLTNDRIYPGKAGYYIAIGNIELGTPIDGKYAQALIYVNGSISSSGSIFRQGANGDHVGIVHDMLYLPTDASYVEMYIYNADASSRTKEGATYLTLCNRLGLMGPL